MPKLMRWLFILFTLAALNMAALAATTQETRSFGIAVKAFEDEKYDIAEKWMSEFVAKYPASEHRTEAILITARSRYHQTNYVGAAQMLEAELPQAGRIADQYRYWIAETAFERGDYADAAEKYRQLLEQFPQSSLKLQTCYGQALSYAKLNQWPKVIEVLGPPESEFQKLASAQPDASAVVHGLLLLGEALFLEKQYGQSAAVLQNLDKRNLAPDARWRQQYWLSRVQLEQGQLEQALVTSSNVVGAATAAAQPKLVAEAANSQAFILERLNRLPEAIQAYERNLAENFAPDIRRRALFKIVELNLAAGKTDEAILRMERFVEQQTNDVALDIALLTIGELKLKQYFSRPEISATNGAATDLTARTNLLRNAHTNLNRVIAEFPGSELLGRAHLHRGWCHWEDGKLVEAEADFNEAAKRLPVSEDQAIARMKLGDTHFRLNEFTNAVSIYSGLVRDYEQHANVKNALLDQTLYQLVRAGLLAGDHAAATDAMRRILEWFPNAGFAQRSLLLVGQEINRSRTPAEARALFQEYFSKATNAALMPEVKLAIARTYMQERAWPMAIQLFSQWSQSYSNHSLLPQSEFCRALATASAGEETNALSLFTNFVTRFPSNSLAATAQNWIGDFYFNQQEFALAEEHYQLVRNYNAPLELLCHSRLGAGRAAFERAADRQGYDEAAKFFFEIINDTNSPPAFVAQSYFALGDVRFSQFLSEPSKSSEDATNYFNEAVTAFSRVAKDFNTNSMGALALSRRGDCHLQWAILKEDATRFDLAANDYSNVVSVATADLATRSQAGVALGRVFEAQGKANVAWEHYARVLYSADSGEFDAKAVKEAGLSAARISESRGEWVQALNLYERLQSVLPSLKPAIEKKVMVAKARLDGLTN